MTIVIVCDVCGDPFQKGVQLFQFKVPTGFDDVAPGRYDICSAKCIYELLGQLFDEPQEQEEPVFRGAELAREGEVKRVVRLTPTEDTVYEIPDTGVPMEGVRVDGKVTEQQRRPRLVTRRDDA